MNLWVKTLPCRTAPRQTKPRLARPRLVKFVDENLAVPYFVLIRTAPFVLKNLAVHRIVDNSIVCTKLLDVVFNEKT